HPRLRARRLGYQQDVTLVLAKKLEGTVGTCAVHGMNNNHRSKTKAGITAMERICMTLSSASSTRRKWTTPAADHTSMDSSRDPLKSWRTPLIDSRRLFLMHASRTLLFIGLRPI